MNQQLAKRTLTSQKIVSAIEQHKTELSQMGARKIGLFGCPADLVLEETIKPRLRPQILSEGRYATGY